MADRAPRVGVVGAGITGLALTHHLAERGVESVALEAADEPGGVIRSTREGGLLLEHGPQRTRLTGPVESLVDALGLRGDLVAGDPGLPMYVYCDGELRRAPFSIRGFLTTDLLSWRGKFRVLAEPLTARGSEDETAAELFSRKFGREAYRNFVGPLFGGIYGSDPAEMPAGYAPSPLLQLERRSGSLLRPAVKRALSNSSTPPVTFEDGLQALPAALYEAHADRVALGRPATAVRAGGDGFVVETPDGEEAVDRLVLTTPADVAADLLADLAPDAADRLDRLAYNPLALVHLAAETDREGFGYQVRPGEGLDTLGVSWNASLFGRGSDGRRGDGAGCGGDGGRDDGAGHEDAGDPPGTDGVGPAPTGREGLYTCFLGGMRNPDLVGAPDSELGAIAADEFETVMGAPAAVVNVTRLERGFPAYDASWTALDGLELPDGVRLATNYTARMGIPGRLREAERVAAELAGEG